MAISIKGAKIKKLTLALLLVAIPMMTSLNALGPVTEKITDAVRTVMISSLKST